MITASTVLFGAALLAEEEAAAVEDDEVLFEVEPFMVEEDEDEAFLALDEFEG